MLFTLYCEKTGEVYMTGDRKRVQQRKTQLETSQRKEKTHYKIREAEDGEEKYRRPPVMNYDPSGDAENYRKKKIKAKRIKRKNT